MSLRNILPYPGIEDVLETHVIEFNLSANEHYRHRIKVGDASHPLKATLVWMDPTNTIMSAKMLINDMDLIVEDPTGKIYYGNGLRGDDVNNVEQVTIEAPTVSDTVYQIRVSTGEYLYGGSQTFSLIVTGGDLTFAYASYGFDGYRNPYCPTGEHLVRITLMDRGADGWSAGQSYRVTKMYSSFVRTGTMSGAVKNDSITSESWCLPSGTYTVTLLNSVDSTDLDEMALELENCKLYLSQYQPSGKFTIGSSTWNYCGHCPGYEISLLLVGSFYGVPYGWIGNTHYSLTQTTWGDDVFMGTLAIGMLREHKYCVSGGVYVLQLHDAPTTDDAVDDDYMEKIVGHEEYYIYVSINGSGGALYPGFEATITLMPGMKGISIQQKDDDDSGDSSSSRFILVVIIGSVLFGLFVCIAIIVQTRRILNTPHYVSPVSQPQP